MGFFLLSSCLYCCLLAFCAQYYTWYGVLILFFSPSQFVGLCVGSKWFLFSGSLNINLTFTQFVCGETAVFSEGWDGVKKQVLEIKRHFIPTHAYNIHTLKTKPVYAQSQHLGHLTPGWCLLEQNWLVVEQGSGYPCLLWVFVPPVEVLHRFSMGLREAQALLWPGRLDGAMAILGAPLLVVRLLGRCTQGESQVSVSIFICSTSGESAGHW